MSFKKIQIENYRFPSRSDDPRIFSHVQNESAQADAVILGYPDDEGIKLNGGRVGAQEAPHEIRKAFYKMTTGFLPEFKIFDEGNIDLSLSLGDRHDQARKKVHEHHKGGRFLLTLGGGHDYGYPDAQGFLDSFKKSKLKPVVINFDAHLDVRPLSDGLTSGTPFYRLLTENPGEFHFIEVGIQPHCNSKTQVDWCEEHGGQILFLKDIEKKSLLVSLKKVLSRFKNHPAFISIDIDGFSSAFAPGCSQSWPTGLDAKDFFKSFDYLFQQLSIKSVGIYEVSPPLDVQPLTSRLAALILYRCLENHLQKPRGQHVPKSRSKSKRIRKR